jgi:hypothetical protein
MRHTDYVGFAETSQIFSELFEFLRKQIPVLSSSRPDFVVQDSFFGWKENGNLTSFLALV